MLQCLSGTLRAHTDITAGWFSFSPLLATCIQALTDAVQQRKSEARWLSLLFAHIPSLLLQSEEQSLTHLFQHHLTSLRHSDFTTISEEHMFCINTGYHGRGGQKWRFRRVDVQFQIFLLVDDIFANQGCCRGGGRSSSTLLLWNEYTAELMNRNKMF